MTLPLPYFHAMGNLNWYLLQVWAANTNRLPVDRGKSLKSGLMAGQWHESSNSSGMAMFLGFNFLTLLP